MAKSYLTNDSIKSLRFKKSGPRNQRVWDGEVSGFGVEVYATGRKKYLFAYRFDGNQKFIMMGDIIDIDLEEARDIAIQYRRDVRQGIDPKKPKVSDLNDLKPSMTLSQLFAAYENDAFESFSADTVNGLKSTYNKYLKKQLGNRAIDTITRGEIKQAHKDIMQEKQGAAKGYLSRVKMIFAYAEEEDALPESPVKGLRGRYAATIDEEDKVWLKTNEQLEQAWFVNTNPVMRALVRWMLLTGCRRDEARTATFSQIEDSVWRVKGTKNKKTLSLPVTSLMQQIVNEMTAMHGSKSAFLFPATTSYAKAVPRGSVHYLLERSGFQSRVLRRTVKSHLAKLKVGLEARSLVQNHTLEGMDKIYNQDEQLAMKLDALNVWHARLQSIISPDLKIISGVA